MTNKKIHLICAARPNFMKVAPLYHAMSRETWCTPLIVHTGQHYDTNMSDAFFRDLGLPQPAHHLEIGSGSHAEQTGRTMIAYEILCTIGKRVTRLYVRHDLPVRVSTLIGERADWSAPVTDYLRRRDAKAEA